MKKYLIVTHDYKRQSAGVRALHKLCHYLNLSGCEAYVTSEVRNPDWVTPLATPELQAEIAQTGVVVYPEVEQGNRLNAKQVARYVLNVPGRIRGDSTFDASESVFLYSDILMRYVPNSSGTLGVPVVDTSIFNDSVYGFRYARNGWVYWIGKGASLSVDFDNVPKHVSEMLEDSHLAHVQKYTGFTFDWPHTWLEMAREFRNARFFLSFTPYTMLTVEARLCGCPTVVIPNSYFTRDDFARAMPGINGLAWGLDEYEIGRAAATVGQFQQDYHESVARFFVQLDRFIDKTQRWVR